MLTLTIRSRRSVVVTTPDGEEIIFTVIRTKSKDEVLIGVKAPDDMPIVRADRWEGLIGVSTSASQVS